MVLEDDASHSVRRSLLSRLEGIRNAGKQSRPRVGVNVEAAAQNALRAIASAYHSILLWCFYLVDPIKDRNFLSSCR
jgi:hypothetical protein